MAEQEANKSAEEEPTLREFLDEGRVSEVYGFEASQRRILTLRRMIALADFCAANPDRWNTIKVRYFRDDLSLKELSIVLNRSVTSLKRDLQPVVLDEDIYSSIPRKEFYK